MGYHHQSPLEAHCIATAFSAALAVVALAVVELAALVLVVAGLPAYRLTFASHR